MLSAEMDAIAQDFPEGATSIKPDAFHELMVHSSKLKNTKRLSNLDNEIEECRHRIEATKEQLENQGDLLKKQEHKKKYLDYQQNQKLKMLTKLYAIVSKIHFYGETGPEDFKGAVVGKQVVPFHLKKSECDSFYITSYLWDLITKSED